MLKPVLLVLAGPNGSGKTTVARQLLGHPWSHGSIYVNPDEIAEHHFGGWNNREAILKAARQADKIRADCLSRRQSLMFETVLSTPQKLDFIRSAKTSGYFIRIFFVATGDPAINARRIARRIQEGGHSVPPEKIISRYAKSIGLGALAARYVDRSYFLDNSVDERDPQMIFRVADGKLKSLYTPAPPRWAEIVAQSILRPEPESYPDFLEYFARELA